MFTSLAWSYLRNESFKHVLQGKSVSFCFLTIEDLSKSPEPRHCLVLQEKNILSSRVAELGSLSLGAKMAKRIFLK